MTTAAAYEVSGWSGHGHQHAATVTWTNGREETLRGACGAPITAKIPTPFNGRLPWACKDCIGLLERGRIAVPAMDGEEPDDA